ncbi:DUF3482 domain-containing protein [Porticoccus sp. W117]|uniref:DUF3482 domain-containing protein n=1 Tax=Porticoccus sp. W117 TaxID=3054777 RepID=UPI002599FD8F|nr:DUF3482 domain-containing protein [Porticoccus sp. W117]MDM3871933.1 DUF3482 domain-containing protein [Porticoccus sp. W117]
MNNCPRFAVVGHPNKGKSSIVATMVHSSDIAISELSGTTVSTESYSYTLDGEPLYTLFDTPGFQRPRQLLEWLQNQNTDASNRLLAVENFLNEHNQVKEGDRFCDEVELLKPIIHDGAGIIYVVDGSVPYSPEYEAEMSVLQWTGQPRMALINPIGGEQFVEQWRQALGQYFSLVKVFNPVSDGADKQLAILRAFAELNDNWRQQLLDAVSAIEVRNRKTKEQAAELIAEALAHMLAEKVSKPLPADGLQKATETWVSKEYKSRLQRKERQLRESILALYQHYGLDIQEADLQLDYPDLFDRDYWYLFGMSRKKLVALASASGAAAGALVDAGVGGSSLMAGAMIGGLGAGITSLYFSHKPDQLSIKGLPLAGKQLTAGPVKNLSFAFVLLGRAVRYQRAVAARAHGDRRPLLLAEEKRDSWLEALDHSQQVKLTGLLKNGHKGLGEKHRQFLQGLISRILL